MAWSDAVRAAAAEIRRRRAAGQPWRRQRMGASVAVSDPTRVGGTLSHNKIMKTIKLRAVTEAQAREKITKFYKKRGYKNIQVTQLWKNK